MLVLMRLLAVVLTLALTPAAASAAPVGWYYLNSNLTFGTNPTNHTGYDGEPVNGHFDWWATTFSVSTGSLVSQTAYFDSRGNPSTRYLYKGGTFQTGFERQSDGLIGSFVAEVLSLELLVREGVDDSGHVEGWYTLGRGIFDKAIAKDLGIPRLTGRGTIEADMLAHPGLWGDPTSSVRHAWDGATFVETDVPEPSLTLLALAGAATAWSSRRLRRRRS